MLHCIAPDSITKCVILLQLIRKLLFIFKETVNRLRITAKKTRKYCVNEDLHCNTSYVILKRLKSFSHSQRNEKKIVFALYMSIEMIAQILFKNNKSLSESVGRRYTRSIELTRPCNDRPFEDRRPFLYRLHSIH